MQIDRWRRAQWYVTKAPGHLWVGSVAPRPLWVPAWIAAEVRGLLQAGIWVQTVVFEGVVVCSVGRPGLTGQPVSRH